MPELYTVKNVRLPRKVTKALNKIGAIFDRAKRTENPPSRNQPLAPGKPARRRAKGDTPARRRKAGKGARKK